MLRSLVLLIISLLFTLPSLAEQFSAAEIEERASQVEGYLLSPFCPGRLLKDCPSSGAADLKKEIRTEVASGKSPEAVRDALLEKYGGSIRAAPKTSGFGLVAWIVPFIFLLIGGFVCWQLLRSAQRGSSSSDSDTELTEEMRKLLKENEK